MKYEKWFEIVEAAAIFYAFEILVCRFGTLLLIPKTKQILSTQKLFVKKLVCNKHQIIFDVFETFFEKYL